MDDFPNQDEEPTGDFSDFSDDEATQPMPGQGGGVPPSVPASVAASMTPSDMANIDGIDRNEYSDEDIRLVYEIVVRAEAILAEELTPESRLPTHALFLAYDEIIAENGLDPSERHISKLVFMVGGVKGDRSLMEKFKAVMTRMDITLDIDVEIDDDAQSPESDRGYRDDVHYAASDGEGRRNMDGDEDMTNAPSDGDNESNGYKSSGDFMVDDDGSTESIDAVRERLLAEMAEAFRKRRHGPFSLVDTFRTWHTAAHYVNYVLTQSDAAHEADLIDDAIDNFHLWRASSAAAEVAQPDSIPAGAYSKRTERIAIRTHEIWLAKKVLAIWRELNEDECRQAAYARLLALRRSSQESVDYDDRDFKENSHLARLAEKTYRNLALSRAFSGWANRLEEEVGKADVAAAAYEMSLKAKVLGVPRNPAFMDAMRDLLANKMAGAGGANAGPVDIPPAGPVGMPGQAVAPEAEQPEVPAPTLPQQPTHPAPVPPRPRPPVERPVEQPVSTVLVPSQPQIRDFADFQPDSSNPQPTYPAPVPPKPRPPVERPVTSLPVPTQPQTRDVVDTPRPSTAIRVTSMSPPSTAIKDAASCACSTSPVETAHVDKSGDDADDSDYDQWDEQTMLARRHILRMRYFGAWQKYTDKHIRKVEQFGEEVQDERMLQLLSAWREQAAGREYHYTDHEMEMEEIRAYAGVTTALLRWRKRAESKALHQQEVLEHYAERAEYYQRTIQALPVLREKTRQATKKDELLCLYAARTNYYLRSTQAISVWRQKAVVASEKHQLQRAYGERADYYYRTKNTVSAWQYKTKEKRKQRLKDAHLETRRIVKKGMGDRCIKQWREKLEPSYARYDVMNVSLANAVEERGLRQTSQAFTTWRSRAQARTEVEVVGDDVLKQKAVSQWRDAAALRTDIAPEAAEYFEMRTKSRALRAWSLSSLQTTNRPEMVASALEKRERRLLRHGFEKWYGRTADKLAPIELADGTYRPVGQVVGDVQQQGLEHRARGCLNTWRTATGRIASQVPVPEEPYAPTPGRPQLLLGSFGNRETTTPMAPVPSTPVAPMSGFARWQGRDSIMSRPEFGTRTARSDRTTRNPKNLRVSWAA
ncbi:hypothetical protein GGR50DRAFT_655870 [Xylaria sp. CBS 124048]|nr:hypothetical protein GGR50DRAFT_655870 [Xylaria sp. CBS 124048]